jgi:hypothetical protein
MNLQNLTIIYDSSGLLIGAQSIDLDCASNNKLISSNIYDISQSPPLQASSLKNEDTVFLTKIENCDGSFYLVSENYGKVSDMMVSLCEVCEQPTPGGGTSVHNELTGKQGGSNGQYFHLDESQYDSVVDICNDTGIGLWDATPQTLGFNYTFNQIF